MFEERMDFVEFLKFRVNAVYNSCKFVQEI